MGADDLFDPHELNLEGSFHLFQSAGDVADGLFDAGNKDML